MWKLEQQRADEGRLEVWILTEAYSLRSTVFLCIYFYICLLLIFKYFFVFSCGHFARQHTRPIYILLLLRKLIACPDGPRSRLIWAGWGTGWDAVRSSQVTVEACC